MARSFLPPGVAPPDFYLAAMGRSGSTMLCNWLTLPPDQLVFSEPSFLHPRNTRLLRIQLAGFGMVVPDEEWDGADPSGADRFRRIMGPRLAGKRWACKEVLCSEHFAVVEALAPGRVLISVRNIADVAMSFFEKHRAQDNLHRFSRGWVADYCVREAQGLVQLQQRLEAGSVPHTVIRYEDFVASDSSRGSLSAVLGWQGGGATDRHMNEYDRGFEVERHGASIGRQSRERGQRVLVDDELDLAHRIEEQCSDYQQAFGYS